MRIDIDLTENDVKYILEKTNYTEENVILWYNKHVGPYDTFDGMDCLMKRIAYPKGKRPKELENEQPLLSELSGNLIENIMPRLFVMVVLNKE